MNMGMAQHGRVRRCCWRGTSTGAACSPSSIGTVALLDRDEQAMVKGLIINKFRGDKTILEPGLSRCWRSCASIPVVGVVPYMDVDLDDEDSLTERFLTVSQEDGSVSISRVIRVPRISNFTDFNPFERYRRACPCAMCRTRRSLRIRI